jgi:hypothetical protein
MPCQTIFHCELAEMIPGSAVMVTCLGGGGCGKLRGAWANAAELPSSNVTPAKAAVLSMLSI